MFEIKFEISHEDCWMQGLYKKFKSRFISHITFSLDKKLTSDIIHVTNNNDKEFNKIIFYLKRHKKVKKLDFLYKDERNLYFQIYTDVSEIHSIVGTIIKFGAYVSKPVQIRNEWEIWTVVIHSKDNLDSLLNSLKKCGKFKLLYIKKSNMDNSNLSNKQKIVMDLAIKLGYYEWPRRISAQELSKKLQISKPTLLQHLRTAESKVIKNNYLS